VVEHQCNFGRFHVDNDNTPPAPADNKTDLSASATNQSIDLDKDELGYLSEDDNPVGRSLYAEEFDVDHGRGDVIWDSGDSDQQHAGRSFLDKRQTNHDYPPLDKQRIMQISAPSDVQENTLHQNDDDISSKDGHYRDDDSHSDEADDIFDIATSKAFFDTDHLDWSNPK
jgi:hypothetical protein